VVTRRPDRSTTSRDRSRFFASPDSITRTS
jgi:hypothetical protein